ncbi:hypothetical protein [Sphingomonas sp. MS122]|uniref:hypothetical protein n=1 Tax=Sphingomonas sp. MS122 TaxID=3412683 RepID=UPI003C2E7CCB
MTTRSRFTKLALAAAAVLLCPGAAAPAAKVEMTTPVFEMFRLAPGKTEDFIRSMAEWDKVSMAGGQPPTQLFLHAGGEGWDVLLYKPARPKPTPAQEAAMAAKAKELGLPNGSRYFLQIREWMADHIHFDAAGPTTAEQWLLDLERERAQARQGK